MLFIIGRNITDDIDLFVQFYRGSMVIITDAKVAFVFLSIVHGRDFMFPLSILINDAAGLFAFLCRGQCILAMFSPNIDKSPLCVISAFFTIQADMTTLGFTVLTVTIAPN